MALLFDQYFYGKESLENEITIMTYMQSITEAIIPSTRVTCPSMCTLFIAHMGLDAIHYDNSIVP